MLRLLRLIRAQARSGSASSRSGSGPSFATAASTCSRVHRSQAVAPRRSATVRSPTRRSRTWPIGAGTPSSAPSYGASWSLPMRPRWMCTKRSPGNSRKSCLPHACAPSSAWPSSWRASSSKRPCGLPTRTGRPARASVRSWASRWRVWPSGTPLVLVLGRAEALRRVGQRRPLAGPVVDVELADPADVPPVVAERLGEEDLHEAGHVLDGVHAAADGHDLRVVVLTAEPRGLVGVDEGAPDPGHLVGGHLLAVAAASDDDA